MVLKLGRKSKRRLTGVNPELAFCVMEAIKISKSDFTVFEGVRSLKRQKEYVARGVSWTLKSKHLSGNAVDLVVWKDGRPQWDNCEKEYADIHDAMSTVIAEHDLKIENGYDMWGKDLPHWQISSSKYDVRKFLSKKALKEITNG